jgi:two-component system, LytTR family, sensor kinase
MWLPASLLTYAAVLAATQALLQARAAHKRQLDAADLAVELAQARLAALRAQIHPHFLFNALHTVAALVREGEPDRAVDVVATLSELLRELFRSSSAGEVPLREELAWLTRYVSIQKARFQQRLVVRWDIGEDALDALVPHLILQPLVENALRHGIAHELAVGRLEVTAKRVGELLELAVRDNGPKAVAPEVREGTGLANTRARLALLYRDRASLTLRGRPGGGAETAVVLPFHEASHASS